VTLMIARMVLQADRCFSQFARDVESMPLFFKRPEAKSPLRY
jgi:hypothetical protein